MHWRFRSTPSPCGSVSRSAPRPWSGTARRLGITSDLQPNASIALGTSEVSPLELVSAYAPFSNGGFGVQPHIIAKVKRTDGKLLYQRKGTGFGRVIDASAVAMMNTMMQETLLTGTARKAELPGWQAAGKTGTSQEWRDAWFVGYTGALTTGVWLGNDDGSPTKKTSGGNLPVDIWSRFMKVALQGTAPVPLPGGSFQQPAAPEPSRQSDPLLSAIGALLGSNPPAPKPTPPPRPAPPVASMPQPAPAAAAAFPSERPARTARANDTEALLPPAMVPGGVAQGSGEERSLLDKLFGG